MGEGQLIMGSMVEGILRIAEMFSAMVEVRSDVAQDWGAYAESIFVASWWGRCNIPSHEIDINIAAHILNNARSKLASIMPAELCLNSFPREDIWPTYFNCSPPNELSIDFIFFSEGRDEFVLDNLLNDAIRSDFGLKAKIGAAELLIFTSIQLPEKLRRLQGKFYFWGIIMARNPFFSEEKLENDVHIEKNELRLTLSLQVDDHMSDKGKAGPVNISDERNSDQEKAGSINISDKQNFDQGETGPMNNSYEQNTDQGKSDPLNISDEQTPRRLFTQTAVVERAGGPLIDAWRHAKQVDNSRKKAECRYCGYISTYGGISCLKVHLAGGSPINNIPGCSNIPPDDKQEMAVWFNENVITPKFFFLKKTTEGHVDTCMMAREPVNGWEHGIPLDKRRQSTKCNYCDFVSIGGGDPTALLKGCPNVPPEVKVLMSEAISPKKAIVKKEIHVTHNAQVVKLGRPFDDAWKHAKALENQKVECNYCGFVSATGGISRMKAHLAGGNPPLPGCPKVSPQVKQEMTTWFNEFVKYSNAAWLTKTPQGPEEWEHAIPLDKIKHSTKCRYCDFVCLSGGIAQLRVHLGGGDPTISLEGCPNVPPEVKSLMSEAMSQKKVTPKDIQEAEKVTNVQGVEKRPYFSEFLEKITNITSKEALRELIEKKRKKLKRVKSEILVLESHIESLH